MSQTIIYTAGVWDLFHYGHLRTLQNSADLCDLLFVGIVSDSGCKAYKGYEPIFDYEDRHSIISALRCVDMAMYQQGTNPIANLVKLRNEYPEDKLIGMTHGSDWNQLKEGQEELEDMDIPLILLPYNREWGSSTEIKQKIRLTK